MFVREHNEQIQQEFNEHKGFADSEHVATILPDDATYNFYCECADEKCAKRIPLTLKTYADLHKVRDHFVIAPEHEVPFIEDVIMKTDKYMIVRKHVQPPETAGSLNPTNLQNK